MFNFLRHWITHNLKKNILLITLQLTEKIGQKLINLVEDVST